MDIDEMIQIIKSSFSSWEDLKIAIDKRDLPKGLTVRNFSKSVNLGNQLWLWEGKDPAWAYNHSYNLMNDGISKVIKIYPHTFGWS